MAAAPRAPTVDKRTLVRIQADMRRLNIIRTNQGKLVTQIQDLLARYSKSETLAGSVQKSIDATVAGIVTKLG